MPVPPAGPWRSPGFRLLWAGQAVSQVGSQITLLALPLTAALALGATPLQMGLLTVAETLPFLLFGLPAGVWADRLPRGPLLVGADLGRCALLLVIPAAALLGLLRFEVLLAVAFSVGCLTTVFEVTSQSYLPMLVPRRHLVAGNGVLETTRAAAQVAGPGLAGGLIQVVSGPLAIALDALSFLVSALVLGRIATPEAMSVSRSSPGLLAEVAEGFQVVRTDPRLRVLAGCSASQNLAATMQEAVVVVYALRELGVGPVPLGLVFAAGNAGLLLGALLSGRLARVLGIGPTLVGSVGVATLGFVLVPLAGGPLGLALAVLACARFADGLAQTVYTITAVSFRQTLIPDHLLGRVNATFRVLAGGAAPIGALLGGAAGESLGLRPALVIGGVLGLGALLWVWRSPVASIHPHPRS